MDTGEFHALRRQLLTTRFHDATTDMVAPGSEGSVAHAPGIPREIIILDPAQGPLRFRTGLPIPDLLQHIL